MAKCFQRCGSGKAQPSFRRDASLAKSVQNNGAADGKTAHGSQGKCFRNLRTEMQQVTAQRGHSKENPQNVQPHRRAHGIGLPMIAEAELQQNRSQTYGAKDHHRKRAEECAPSGEKHDQGDRTTKKSEARLRVPNATPREPRPAGTR